MNPNKILQSSSELFFAFYCTQLCIMILTSMIEVNKQFKSVLFNHRFRTYGFHQLQVLTKRVNLTASGDGGLMTGEAVCTHTPSLSFRMSLEEGLRNISFFLTIRNAFLRPSRDLQKSSEAQGGCTVSPWTSDHLSGMDAIVYKFNYLQFLASMGVHLRGAHNAKTGLYLASPIFLSKP